ncbi:MAG: hypothetical protein ABIR98_15810 [Usitatibacter sp.]
MESIEAERGKVRARAKTGWRLIAIGFGVVVLVFAAVRGLGVEEGSTLFTVLVVAAYTGGAIALVGWALIMMFHLYDRSYPRSLTSKSD